VFGRRRKAIEAQAASWVVRLGEGPLREADRCALDRWLAESPAHGTVFEHARLVWTDLGGLKAAPGPLLGDRVPPPRRATPAPNRRSPANSARVLPGAVLAALAVLAAALGIFWLGDPLLALEADYRTAPGESRSVALADGSVVQLGTDSAIAVHFDTEERQVELLSGEAYFTVAPIRGTETRPFIVTAAGGTTKALGTRFMVERLTNGGEVTAAEHLVQVATTVGEPGAVVLSPGQRVRYDRAFGIGNVMPADLGQATAWRHGQLIFDKVRLAAVVAELNRYRRGRIVIARAALADRRVSGVFETADLPAAVASITRELKARTAALPPFLTVLY
jgi:transmembrane sensor